MLDSNRLGQSALWAHGVSGDLPIVLRLDRAPSPTCEHVKLLLRAQAYWQAEGSGRGSAHFEYCGGHRLRMAASGRARGVTQGALAVDRARQSRCAPQT